MTTITSHPQPRVPLALSSAGYGDAARVAQGFGAIGSAQIAQLEKHAMLVIAKLLDGKLTSRPHADVGTVVGNKGEPVLAAPDMARVGRALGAHGLDQNGARLSGAAALTALLGLLTKNLGAQTLASMQANVTQRTSSMQARAEQGKKLDQAMQDAHQAEQQAAAAAEAAVGEAQQAQAAAEAARAEADRLQSELDGMDPQDPAYADAESALGDARQTQAQAQRNSEAAAGRALDAGKAYSDATQQYKQAVQDVQEFNREDPAGIREPALNELTSRSARMQALIGQLSDIMSDASLDKLRSDAEAAMKQMEASQKEQLRLAKEQEAELERMREAEQKSGCAGKIFGWVGKALAAVGSALAIVAGALTANPALVVAGVVGMALTIDSIQAEFTGFSVMGKVTEAIGGVIAKALVSMGVDEALAQQIGNVVATIVIMVAIIAASMAAGNVGAAVNTISKAATTLKKVVEIIQVAAQMANLGSTVAVGAGNVIVAGIQVDIAELLAMLEKLGFNDEVLREMLAMVQEAAALLSRTGAELMIKASDMLADEVQTAKAVMRGIATTAARA